MAAERDFDEVLCILIVDLYYRFLIEIYILGLVVTSCHIMKKKWLSPLMTINLRNKTESIHLHDNNLHKNDLSIINKKNMCLDLTYKIFIVTLSQQRMISLRKNVNMIKNDNVNMIKTFVRWPIRLIKDLIKNHFLSILRW